MMRRQKDSLERRGKEETGPCLDCCYVPPAPAGSNGVLPLSRKYLLLHPTATRRISCCVRSPDPEGPAGTTCAASFLFASCRCRDSYHYQEVSSAYRAVRVDKTGIPSPPAVRECRRRAAV